MIDVRANALKSDVIRTFWQENVNSGGLFLESIHAAIGLPEKRPAPASDRITSLVWPILSAGRNERKAQTPTARAVLPPWLHDNWTSSRVGCLMPYLLFWLLCVIWGSSFILMKKAGLVFGPIGVGAGRVFGGATILVILWWLNRRRWAIAGRHMPHIVALGVLGYSWPYALQPYLVVLYGSGFIGMTVAFTPLLTILVSIPMLGQYPTRRQLAGVLGGLVCMAVIMVDGLDREVPPAALLLAFTVPLSYAVANTYIKQKLHDVASLPVTCGAMVAAALLLVPLANMHSLLEPYNLSAPAIEPTPDEWQLAVGSLLVLGVIGTGIATYVFNKLVLDHGPLFAGMVTYLVPLGAIAWGWADAETVSGKQIAALLGVLAMVAVVQYRAAESPLRPRSTPSERTTKHEVLVDENR